MIFARSFPCLATPATRNGVAIESGSGMVEGLYATGREGEGRGVVRLRVVRLLSPGRLSQTLGLWSNSAPGQGRPSRPGFGAGSGWRCRAPGRHGGPDVK
jgi:hypothetical protein